jgi:hypothetical protein
MAKDPWSRTLPEPIVLPGRRIETLRDAPNFMAKLSDVQRKNLHWRLTAEALIKAQYYDATPEDVDAFAQQALAGARVVIISV